MEFLEEMNYFFRNYGDQTAEIESHLLFQLHFCPIFVLSTGYYYFKNSLEIHFGPSGAGFLGPWHVCDLEKRSATF